MIAAGLLAKRAVEKGLRVKKFVKTSLAPGYDLSFNGDCVHMLCCASYYLGCFMNQVVIVIGKRFEH